MKTSRLAALYEFFMLGEKYLDVNFNLKFNFKILKSAKRFAGCNKNSGQRTGPWTSSCYIKRVMVCSEAREFTSLLPQISDVNNNNDVTDLMLR